MSLLEIDDLHVGIVPRRGPEAAIVRGISVSVERGQKIALVGESGCGKSVTALAIMRLLRGVLRVSAGRVLLDGVDVLQLSERQMNKVRGARIGMIDQNPMSALNPVQTIGAQLVEALRLHSNLSRRDARTRAIELLAEVGVSRPEKRIGAYPHEFSGGMRQRVVIAMALSGEPNLVIADEPTTALDVTTQARIMDMLAQLAADRALAVLLITHDLGVAAGFCDEVHVMYAGRIVERADVDALFARPVHPYSEALLSSVCDLSTPIDSPVPSIGGQPPLPGELEGVCSFSPRCRYAEDICRRERPQLSAVPSALVACHFALERSVSTDGRV